KGLRKRQVASWELRLDDNSVTYQDFTNDFIQKPLDLATITGQPAYSVKKIIRGEVGKDVLVVVMTRPDSIEEMRYARAVITDEGGVLSHAAIICRELHIPCIVGTKY